MHTPLANPESHSPFKSAVGVLLLMLYATPDWLPSAAAAGPAFPTSVQPLLSQHCFDCHSGDTTEGGLNLQSLLQDRSVTHDERRWARIIDRVAAGEMPPPETATLSSADRDKLIAPLGRWLQDNAAHHRALTGRVPARRLTSVQLERSLHALLGIDRPLADTLPPETPIGGFTTVVDGQTFSDQQMEQHLATVDLALDDAFLRAARPSIAVKEKYLAERLCRTDPRRRTREPEFHNRSAVIWSSRLIFYGRMPITTAPEDGWYRFSLSASGLNIPSSGGVWCTIRSGPCVSSAPLLAWVGAFEATSRPKLVTFECWLPKGHMLEIRPGDAELKMAKFANGQVGAGEGGPQNVPGLAMHSLSVERIHRGGDQRAIQRLLFGVAKVEGDGKGKLSVTPRSPREDSAALIRQFAERAFRRPTSADDVTPYVTLTHHLLDEGLPFADALRGGYRAMLCSPRFLFLQESPGALDDYAVASRLSYFLWNRPPDEELMELAKAGRLRDAEVLRLQVRRMLKHQFGADFIRDFAAQWLDLSEIDFTEPDPKLYPNFDVIVQQSMLDETHAFLQTMLDENLSVSNLVESDFTFLNSRLARHYEVPGVLGDKLRKVSVSRVAHRGGLLTQGAILKVTANGANTSPVTRGVWVAERILGEEIPPPPENIPAVEPDIRGATTIREVLEKHRSDASCAACHKKIDPPGFALENYDPAGRWRERYITLSSGKRKDGPKIDPSYKLDDGRAFTDLKQFQSLIASEPERLARNVVEKMVTYGTGGAPEFADRAAVSTIAAATRPSKYGLRSLVEEVVLSPLFLTK